MNPIVLLVFVAVAVLVLVALNGLTRRGGGRASIGYPYGPQRALFTPAERSFFGALEQAVGETHRIFGKVRLADVIKVNAGLTRSAHHTRMLAPYAEPRSPATIASSTPCISRRS